MSAANRGSNYSSRNDTEERSGVIYDHLGNLVTKTRLADLVPKEYVKRAVFNINTGDHRIINKLHKNQDRVIWRALATEIDNNAVIHCFGSKI